MRNTVKICLTLLILLGASLAFSGGNSVHAQAATKGKIAFIAGNGIDLVVLNLDNNAQTNATQGRLTGLSAFAWSPDGTQLVVSADRGSNLYVVSADGSGVRALTHNTGFAITQTPTWSPDGTQIAYVGNAAQNYDIFIIGADGNNGRRLTNTNGIYRDLAWSPDGTRIAYASGPDFFNVKIYVMNADGTAPTQLSTGGGSDIAPAWSPDGSRIAYENDLQFGPAEIFVMSANGSNQTRLTTNFKSDRHPTWSPDGSQIAFSSDREGNYALHLMNADGSGQTRLTNNSTAEGSPAWQPNGTTPTATPTPSPVYSVSGNIVDLNGSPVAGALVNIELSESGTIQTRTVQTDTSGNYSSGELGCQNRVTLTPSKLGYTFSPTGRSFVSTRCLSGSDTANFVATSDATARFTISGRVTDGFGNGIPGATVTLSGTQGGMVQSDASGNYAFGGLPAGGDYTLSPSKEGQYLRFAANVSNLSGNTTLNLTLRPYVEVRMRVADAAGNGIANVAMRTGNSTLPMPHTNSFGNLTILFTYSLTAHFQVTLTPIKYGYTFDPPNVTISTAGGNQVVNFTATLGNQIDDPQFFVRRHYLDFFGRQADDAGLAFWTANIASCDVDVSCIEVKRIDTSAAFFLSIEFQQTGYLVHRFYKAAYGDIPGKPVPLTFAEFMPDTQRIGQDVVVNSTGWEVRLEANKRAYANEFVSRTRFAEAYPATLTPAQYVDKLNQNTGNSLTQAERDALVNDLATGAKTRAEVLRQVAENPEFANREKNRAFVLSQYFGYLRRDPDAAPNTDFSGYNFWLGKLNEFNGDFRAAEMVKAFITSGEYRQRFEQ
jgi:Tol biopolymer transport system component